MTCFININFLRKFVTDFSNKADFYVINTCSVTDNADKGLTELVNQILPQVQLQIEAVMKNAEIVLLNINTLFDDETKNELKSKKNYFDDTQFYRVINNFVIQAGNSDNRKISQKRKEIGRYLLPNDLNKGYTHKRGMISMPSSLVDNPYKMASPFEFFIVQSSKGAHHLDGNYTVFGKVIRGMDTVDKIASTPTDNLDWPLQNIYIKKVEIIE